MGEMEMFEVSGSCGSDSAGNAEIASPKGSLSLSLSL